MQKQLFGEPWTQEVVTLYQDGATIMDLSRKFQKDKTVIARILHDAKARPMRGKLTLPPDVMNRALEMREHGSSMNEISEALHIPIKRLGLNLHKAGLDTARQVRLHLTPDQQQSICAQYQNGAPLSKLAKQFDRTIGAIFHVLERHGVERRKRGNTQQVFTRQAIETIIDLYQVGRSQEEIAGMFGVSQTAVIRLLIRNGITKREMSGANNGQWKGGRSVTDDGYVMVKLEPEHPLYSMARFNGYVLEHRLVMAEHLGRPLREDETVHHINDQDRQNNVLTNLQLRIGQHGKSASYRCAKCHAVDLEALPLGTSVLEAES